MTQTLYSARTEIDRDGNDHVRISKFVDGELESSYLTTLTECDCPAGHRPSCRHRQMLPMMSAHRILNTHWFWDFDTHRVVDFSGELKSNLDALNELAAKKDLSMTAECPPRCCEPFTESIIADLPPEHPAHSGHGIGRITLPPAKWRRL